MLNASHNAIASLAGLGRATGLEVLQLGHNKLTELGGLAACALLRELTVDGNALGSLRGLSRWVSARAGSALGLQRMTFLSGSRSVEREAQLEQYSQ